MNKIINNRLIVSSSKDPAINTKKKSRCFIDLKSFLDENDISEFLWNENVSKIKIKNSSINEISNILNSFSEPYEFLNYCYDNSINITKTNEKLLLNNFKSNKQKVIDDILKKSLTLSKIFQKIQLEANKIQQEENIYPLYLSAFYLNGKDVNNTSINSPLLLYEVSISITNGNIYINKNEDLPIVNEKVNYYLKQNYSINIDESNLQFPNDFKVYSYSLQKICEQNKMELPFETFDNASNDLLNIKPYVSLSLIEPRGGVIKKDIEKINEENEELFVTNNDLNDPNDIINEVLRENDIVEINRPLNIYQKYAIQSALNQNTLIFGPPGTGKSETISSLIANIILNEKNILMVSEKMAALEVLENRLGELSKLSLFAFKPEHKEKFYDQLLNLQKEFQKTTKNRYRYNHDKIKKEYNKILNQLSSISNIEKEIENEFGINKFFDTYSKITENEFVEFNKIGNKLFQEIDLIFEEESNILESYDLLKKLNNLFFNQNKILSILSKYNFVFNKERITDFLNVYNEQDKPSWMLHKFAKDKRRWYKKPLFIKKQVEYENEIIDLFNQFLFLNIDLTFEVNNAMFLLNKINILDNEEMYNKYLIFSLGQKIFSKYNLKNETIQKLKNNYIELRKKEASTLDKFIYEYYIDNLKDQIKSDRTLYDQCIKVFGKANLKRRPAINKLIKNFYDILRILFPIWILSPIQTCILTPCEKNIFDYGIYDEASQMFVERAIPLVYRCSINVVAGDDKQLQPTSFFTKRSYDEEEIDEQDDESFGESLFEQANVCMWEKFHLKNHYRSDSYELIEFSNKYVYDNNLEYATKNKINLRPIIVFNVDGDWINRINRKEADKVIEIINKYGFTEKSILVVTMNISQANYLENYFINNFTGTKVMQRYMDNKIKIRSIENVQGDEADIVILSISYGKNEKGKVLNFFGPISQANGINRLNVAITRAKEQMIVVKSLYSEDINTSSNENNNVFKYFIKFVDDYHLKDNKKISYSKEFKSDYHKEVFTVIKKLLDDSKYELYANYQIGKDSIDIAIVDKISDLVVKAIQLDNFMVHNSLQWSIEDLDKQQFIEDLGYPFIRILELEWKTNKINILKNIFETL